MMAQLLGSDRALQPEGSIGVELAPPFALVEEGFRFREQRAHLCGRLVLIKTLLQSPYRPSRQAVPSTQWSVIA